MMTVQFQCTPAHAALLTALYDLLTNDIYSPYTVLAFGDLIDELGEHAIAVYDELAQLEGRRPDIGAAFTALLAAERNR